MINNIPFLMKEVSTLLALSAAIALLLLANPLLLPLSNPLLQPVQAQTTTMTFETPSPADGTWKAETPSTLTFEAHGTNSSDLQTMTGSFVIKSAQTGNILDSGNIDQGQFRNYGRGASISLNVIENGRGILMGADCKTSDNNRISFIDTDGSSFTFFGAVECSTAGGNSVSSSMIGTTSTQDRDGDGIPDSGDRCDHNSNQRCYKESK
ncbi:MAG TPA: hypothetical protein VGE97_00595 [Nitrososphaera sp.]